MNSELKDGALRAITTSYSRMVEWIHSLPKTRSLTESKGLIPQLSTLPMSEELTVKVNLKITVQKHKN